MRVKRNSYGWAVGQIPRSTERILVSERSTFQDEVSRAFSTAAGRT